MVLHVAFFLDLTCLGQFRHLDIDQNGMLSRMEMSRFRSGSFTTVFLDRLFEENQTYRGQLVCHKLSISSCNNVIE